MIKLCKCGCGNKIIIQKHHKYYGIPDYILGHHAKINNPFHNKHHTEKTKKKMCESHKNCKSWNKGKTDVYSKETLEKMFKSKKGKYIKENNPFYNKHHTKETLEKISRENSIHWQGGISFEPYCPKFNNVKKEEIREQYDRKCFLCGLDEKDQIKDQIERKKRSNKLIVHHVDYDKEQGCNGKTFELVPLCISCHGKTGFNREYWRNKFINKLENE